jgi:hypothetical protein
MVTMDVADLLQVTGMVSVRAPGRAMAACFALSPLRLAVRRHRPLLWAALIQGRFLAAVESSVRAFAETRCSIGLKSRKGQLLPDAGGALRTCRHTV